MLAIYFTDLLFLAQPMILPTITQPTTQQLTDKFPVFLEMFLTSHFTFHICSFSSNALKLNAFSSSVHYLQAHYITLVNLRANVTSQHSPSQWAASPPAEDSGDFGQTAVRVCWRWPEVWHCSDFVGRCLTNLQWRILCRDLWPRQQLQTHRGSVDGRPRQSSALRPWRCPLASPALASARRWWWHRWCRCHGRCSSWCWLPCEMSPGLSKLRVVAQWTQSCYTAAQPFAPSASSRSPATRPGGCWISTQRSSASQTEVFSHSPSCRWWKPPPVNMSDLMNSERIWKNSEIHNAAGEDNLSRVSSLLENKKKIKYWCTSI